MAQLPEEVVVKIRALPSRTSHVVRPWAETTPSATALVEGDRAMTYAELANAIKSAGQWLVAHSVRPGDRVMIVGENCIALAALLLAASEIDAWPLVVNARLSQREIDTVREHSAARVVVFTHGVSTEAARHADRIGAIKETVAGIGEVAISASNEAAVVEPVHAQGNKQVGALIYTSGTTGAPKGVMLSHHSLLFAALIGGVARGLGPQDRFYGVTPMSHIAGMSVFLSALLFGASIELVSRFDAKVTLEAFRKGRIGRFAGVPTMYTRLLELSGGSIECPGVAGLSVAGAPLDPALKRAVEAAFGKPLHNGYGITECAPAIAFTRPDDPRPDSTVGPPMPGIEIRLLGLDGKPVPAGEVGELHVRGPNVMLGYYKAADATAAAIDAQGWFNTGDLAKLDGPYMHIVGRTKELIIRSGFNVYPVEVEGVLAEHPAVANCAVVGRKVSGNEEVVAFVQLLPGASVSASELSAFAAGKLAPYKRPTEFVIKDILPVTAAGKIRKHQLAVEARRPAE